VTRTRRRLTIALIIVTVLAAAVFAVIGAVAWLSSNDSTPDGSALRARLDEFEADRFVRALVATRHTTRSQQEVLTCESGDIARGWNLREVVSGGIGQDAIDDLLVRSADFGWPAGASGTYRKTIAPGVVVELVVELGDDNLQIVANASSGLPCDQA
jgi:hypothetical protein